MKENKLLKLAQEFAVYVIIRFGLITYNFIDSIPLTQITYITSVMIFFTKGRYYEKDLFF